MRLHQQIILYENCGIEYKILVFSGNPVLKSISKQLDMS